MADGLLASGLNYIDQQKQALAARLGLLMNNPQEFAAQLGSEARQRAGVGLLGEPKTAQDMASGAWINSPYGQQAMQVGSGFAGGVKPVGKTGIPSPQSLSMPLVPTVEQMKQYGRVEVVPLSKAVSFQSARNWEKFNAGKGPGDLVKGYGDKPLALRLETGEYVIYDGNHRTDLALQKGKTEMPMHVIDVKSYDPEVAGIKPAPPRISDDELLNMLFGNTKYRSPEQSALDIASQNAEKMLGLPKGNTPMDRAKALGFTESGYTGTNRDITAFDPLKAGASGSGSREGALGTWLTNDPRVASGFADWSARGQGGNVVYPLMIRGKNPREFGSYAEIKDLVDANTQFVRPPYRMMQDTINYENVKKALGDYGVLRNTMTDALDVPITQYVVPDPSRLRSRFAAFDPARVNEPDILAAGVPLGLLAGTNVEMPKKEKRK